MDMLLGIQVFIPLFLKNDFMSGWLLIIVIMIIIIVIIITVAFYLKTDTQRGLSSTGSSFKCSPFKQQGRHQPNGMAGAKEGKMGFF